MNDTEKSMQIVLNKIIDRKKVFGTSCIAGISLLAGVLATSSMSYFGNKPSILIL